MALFSAVEGRTTDNFYIDQRVLPGHGKPFCFLIRYENYITFYKYYVTHSKVALLNFA